MSRAIIAPKPMQKRAKIYIGLLTFAVAVSALIFGYFVTNKIEYESKRAAERAVPVRDVGWVSIKTDGMKVLVGGEAPDHVASMRVLESVGKVLQADRIKNSMKVPVVEVSDPETHLEIVQNDQVSSIVGLMPKVPSPVGLYRALDRAQPLIQTLNLVEDNVADAEENWEDVLTFLEYAVSTIPRVKITATPKEVKIVAVVKTQEEAAEKRKLLTEKAPASIQLVLDIDAPRPLIAPFVFAIEKKAEDVTVTQCSATNVAELNAMKTSVQGDKVAGFDDCQMGLGAPTEQWGSLITTIMKQVQKAPAYKVVVNDNQVDIGLSDQIDEKSFDKITSEIRANLPPGFGMDARSMVTIRTIEELKSDGDAVTLSIVKGSDGKVKITGVMGSKASSDNLNGFAVAKFGTENVDVNANVVDGLPGGWEQNAFTLLEAMSKLQSGEGVLSEKQFAVKGKAKTQSIANDIDKMLKSETLNVAVASDFDVELKEEFSESSATALACVEQMNSILTQSPIQFESGRANISAVSNTAITKLAQVLYNCRDYPLEIGGHTDSAGTAKANQELSQKRAEAVLNAVHALALDFGPITARGYGASEPIASNETEEGRAKNRRIEIRLLDKEGK